MIYKFISQAEGDVIMLEGNGDQLLTIIGRNPSAQWIIPVSQIPAAIAALDSGIITHEAAEGQELGHLGTEVAASGDSVRLRARATPFIELLRNSARAGKDVVWGV